MSCDFRIAKKAGMFPIEKIAKKLGIASKYLQMHGRYIAKIDLGILKSLVRRPQGKYILVTAMTPTPLGEGKTVTTIGLSMALNRSGVCAAACIRQPSMGPVFGIKGSAAGGGYSQVLPREDFDLHFTGDAHAVTLAHNLAAAFLDNSLFRGNPHKINPEKIYWPRVVDIGDRSLRRVKVGCGDRHERESSFDITPASEIMAVLALSKNLLDLRVRLGRIVLAETKTGRPVTTEDIKVAGIMAVLLKDAIKPNLIQTLEHTPCFVHTGPFANIAHGNSSIIQDEIALKVADYVVTEAGFGADCGAEKFFDIKCRVSGKRPDAAVLVCSIRSLKAHGGLCNIIPGKSFDPGLMKENIAAIEKGMGNLIKQIENVMTFGVPVVVAINRFSTDTAKELEFVRTHVLKGGAFDCQVSELWARGSKGGIALAQSVMRASEAPKKIKLLYSVNADIKEKITVIAQKMYGAKKIEFSALALKKIKLFSKRGWDSLPICMAKTPLSLSHDPLVKGFVSGFTLPVRDVRAYIGAGFLTVLCGSIQTMPGLPSHPRGEQIDISVSGDIKGLG